MTHFRKRVVQFATLLILTFPPLSIANVTHQLNGVWQSEGYGYLFNIDGTKVSIYEQTSISCLPSGLNSGKLIYTDHKAAPKEATFKVSIPGFIDADMQIHSGPSDRKKLFHRTDTNTFITVNRINKLPNNCLDNRKTDPQSVYSVFKQTFFEHYPFFEGKKINWSDETLIQKNSLFNSLINLVKPLNDSHIAIVAPDIEEFYFGHEEIDSDKGNAPNVDIPLLAYCNDQLQFGLLKENIGYLRIKSFTAYSESGDSDANLQALNGALDTIVDQLHNSKGLIVDVSQNKGGSDKLAIALAGRLTSLDYVAYNKQAFINSNDNAQWTAPHVTWVKKGVGQTHFDGQLTVMISHDTMSAGETFTMALMNRKPEVKRIGQNTRGSFSDMLPRALPNGWLFALPNERYLDSHQKSYDHIGIPPHKITAHWNASLNVAIESILAYK